MRTLTGQILRRTAGRGLIGLAPLLLAMVLAPWQPAHAKGVSFTSPRDALHQGISAFRSGNYAIAIPALEYAMQHKAFSSRYYLARIHADNNGAYTDHAKAYQLLYEFVSDHAHTDPADYRKVPAVSSALTRVARYVRDGIPEIGVIADAHRAVEYFRHSATFFNNEDAQFELAKLRLSGQGLRRSVPLALHWLGLLSRKGHPGAQAFLADLTWRGKYTRRNPVKALALINVAIANAPLEDRVWIEDIHQNIFCGANLGTRQAVVGMVAAWRSKFGRNTIVRETDSLSSLSATPVRTCANGEVVRRIEPATQIAVEPAKPNRPANEVEFNYGRTR